MGGYEAPKAEGHVVLAADDRDGAEHEAVVEERVEGEEACGDASGEGEEADRDVVGHDAGGGLGFDAEDAVGPHLVLIEVGDLVGAEEHDAEVWAEHDDEGSEEAGGYADEGGGEEVAGESAEEARVSVGEEVPEAGPGDAAAGVDVVMGSGDEAVEVLLEGAGAAVGSNGGEVGGGLAVEKAEIAEVGGRERLDSTGFDLMDERVEAVPVMLACIDPEVGEHRG